MGCAIVDADAFEATQVRERQLAIFGAGGDDDGARFDLLAGDKLDGIGPLVAMQPCRRARDGDLGAELLRLGQRAASQRLAGDAGGKAESFQSSSSSLTVRRARCSP